MQVEPFSVMTFYSKRPSKVFEQREELIILDWYDPSEFYRRVTNLAFSKRRTINYGYNTINKNIHVIKKSDINTDYLRLQLEAFKNACYTPYFFDRSYAKRNLLYHVQMRTIARSKLIPLPDQIKRYYTHSLLTTNAI